MSLKLRLILSIGISFALALLLGGALATWRAKQSVQTEMQAALKGGADIVDDVSRARPSDLERIVRSFNGLRHLRATLTDGGGKLVAASTPALPADEAPSWFERPIAPPNASLRLTGPPLPNGWVMTLTTDPRNEIAEVWGQTRDALAAMIVFCAGTGLLVYLFAIRSFRALPEFGRALGNVAEGEYGTKLSETGPPEFARLAHGYNKMAARLSQYERENERLQSQIMKVQEEERAEIARDLHDEVGPFLFSINVDAAAIPVLATSQQLAAVEERSGRIGQAAGHIQQSVKSILRQLKPVDVLDFGLDTAIRELFSFWQARTPDLRLELRYALAGQTLARDQEEAVYRVVQESLSNAVRHGRPASIVVSLTMDADAQLVVVIEDDGSGLPPRRSAGGAGLDGMAERMRGLGGRLSVRNKAAGSGVIVTAILPLAAKGET